MPKKLCITERSFIKRFYYVDKASLGLSNNVFISENLTRQNSKISYHCRRLKRSGKIDQTYTRDGVVHISRENVENGKLVKIYHMNKLAELFPEFDFEEDPNASIQSSY